MRFLSVALVSVFIFYLGVQAGSMNQSTFSEQTIQTEEDVVEQENHTVSFMEKHQAVLAHTEEHGESQLFGIAMFLEDVIKQVFSILFQFLYRFSAMFF